MKEILIHKRLNTKNVLHMANSEDPDETLGFAVSHLGLFFL